MAGKARLGRLAPGVALAVMLLAPLLPGHAQGSRRRMGLTMQGESGHIFITQLDEGGPADKAGLKVGDEIQTIAGIPAARLDPGVLRIITDTAKTMRFVVWRGDKRVTVDLTPGTYIPRTPSTLTLPPVPGTRSS